jgi:hypothetical protein
MITNPIIGRIELALTGSEFSGTSPAVVENYKYAN